MSRLRSLFQGSLTAHLPGQHDQETHGNRDGGDSKEPKELSVKSEAAKAQEILSKFGVDVKVFGIPPQSFPPDAISRSAATIARLMEEYPQLAEGGQIRGLHFAPLPDNAFAVHTNIGGVGGITVNTELVSQQNLREQIDAGFHVPVPIGKEIEGLVTHEAAHALMATFDKGQRNAFVDRLMDRSEQAGINIRSMDYLSHNLSRYASASPHEVSAEAFAEYKVSPEPRLPAQVIGSVLEDVLLGRMSWEEANRHMQRNDKGKVASLVAHLSGQHDQQDHAPHGGSVSADDVRRWTAGSAHPSDKDDLRRKFAQALPNAPRMSQPLYRTLRHSYNSFAEEANFEVGQQLRLGPQSFTKDPAFAEQYGQGASRRVIFEVAPGAPGIDISDRGVAREQEVISGGNFLVTSVQMQDERTRRVGLQYGDALTAHLPGQHDQGDHAPVSGKGSSSVDGPKVADIPEGDWDLQASDALAVAMGVIDVGSGKGSYLKPGEKVTSMEADENGFPVLVDWVRTPGHPGEGSYFAAPLEESERPVPYVFRAVSEEDYQRIMSGGVIDTDQRMNLSNDEGLVTEAPHSLPTFYLPGKLSSQRDTGEYEGRIIRIRLEREDGWRLDPNDQYVKTDEKVPASRIDMVSPVIVIDSSDKGQSKVRNPVTASVQITPDIKPMGFSMFGGELWAVYELGVQAGPVVAHLPGQHDQASHAGDGSLSGFEGETRDYRGTVGDRSHITRDQTGTIRTDSIASLKGVMGEVPGAHRNRQGEDWESFKEDIKQNGMREPIFITVDHGEPPKISEGNHRRDAAVELGLDRVPVHIRYFGHAEQQGLLAHLAGQHDQASHAPDPKAVSSALKEKAKKAGLTTHRRMLDLPGDNWRKMAGFILPDGSFVGGHGLSHQDIVAVIEGKESEEHTGLSTSHFMTQTGSVRVFGDPTSSLPKTYVHANTNITSAQAHSIAEGRQGPLVWEKWAPGTGVYEEGIIEERTSDDATAAILRRPVGTQAASLVSHLPGQHDQGDHAGGAMGDGPKDSVIKQPLYHFTSAEAANSIREGGFRASEGIHGTFVHLAMDPGVMAGKRWADTTLSVDVDAKNPLEMTSQGWGNWIKERDPEYKREPAELLKEAGYDALILRSEVRGDFVLIPDPEQIKVKDVGPRTITAHLPGQHEQEDHAGGDGPDINYDQPQSLTAKDVAGKEMSLVVTPEGKILGLPGTHRHVVFPGGLDGIDSRGELKIMLAEQEASAFLKRGELTNGQRRQLAEIARDVGILSVGSQGPPGSFIAKGWGTQWSGTWMEGDNTHGDLARLLDKFQEVSQVAAEAWRKRDATTASLTAAAKPTDGVAICYGPTAEEAGLLKASTGDSPPGGYHLTLAYLGDAKDLSQEVHDIAIESLTTLPFVAGKITGHAHFEVAEGGEVPCVLLASVPDLAEIRTNLVKWLKAKGVEQASKHDFVPHLTVRYHNAGSCPGFAGNPIGQELTLSPTLLWAGDSTRYTAKRIVQNDNEWCVESEKGKSLGCYETKAEAVERLRQVEWFKAHKSLTAHLPGQHDQQDHAPDSGSGGDKFEVQRQLKELTTPVGSLKQGINRRLFGIGGIIFPDGSLHALKGDQHHSGLLRDGLGIHGQHFSEATGAIRVLGKYADEKTLYVESNHVPNSKEAWAISDAVTDMGGRAIISTSGQSYANLDFPSAEDIQSAYRRLFKEESLVAHLPGQHDQADHAPGGGTATASRGDEWTAKAQRTGFPILRDELNMYDAVFLYPGGQMFSGEYTHAQTAARAGAPDLNTFMRETGAVRLLAYGESEMNFEINSPVKGTQLDTMAEIAEGKERVTISLASDRLEGSYVMRGDRELAYPSKAEVMGAVRSLTREAALIAHLPGQHDQGSHAPGEYSDRVPVERGPKQREFYQDPEGTLRSKVEIVDSIWDGNRRGVLGIGGVLFKDGQVGILPPDKHHSDISLEFGIRYDDIMDETHSIRLLADFLGKGDLNVFANQVPTEAQARTIAESALGETIVELGTRSITLDMPSAAEVLGAFRKLERGDGLVAHLPGQHDQADHAGGRGGEKDPPQRDLTGRLAKKYGYTEHLNDAAWLTPDGRFIATGRHDSDHAKGYPMEHWLMVEDVGARTLGTKPWDRTHGWAATHPDLTSARIRFSNGPGVVEFGPNNAPTPRGMEALADNYDGRSVTIDALNAKGERESFSLWDGDTPTDLKRELRDAVKFSKGETIVAHLQGQHDQEDHAPTGRGSNGPSISEELTTRFGTTTDPAEANFITADGRYVSNGKAETGKRMEHWQQMDAIGGSNEKAFDAIRFLHNATQDGWSETLASFSTKNPPNTAQIDAVISAYPTGRDARISIDAYQDGGGARTWSERDVTDADIRAAFAEGKRWAKGDDGPFRLVAHLAGQHDQETHGNRDGGDSKEPKEPSGDTPIKVGGDIKRAAELLSEGKRVELDQPREVSTLLSELASRVEAAKAAGEKPPNIDLCDVSVSGTNLFCAEHKDIPRINMPQLKGVPEAGSQASVLDADSKGEVDITDQFVRHMVTEGYKLSGDVEQASYLRATQNELNGGKVAGMYNFLQGDGKFDPGLMIVSKDNYIVDGHHRWAAQIAHDTIDNQLGDAKISVIRIDADIGTLLEESKKFAAQWGIPQVGVSGGTFKASITAHLPGGHDQADHNPHNSEELPTFDAKDITKALREATQEPWATFKELKSVPEGAHSTFVTPDGKIFGSKNHAYHVDMVAAIHKAVGIDAEMILDEGFVRTSAASDMELNITFTASPSKSARDVIRRDADGWPRVVVDGPKGVESLAWPSGDDVVSKIRSLQATTAAIHAGGVAKPQIYYVGDGTPELHIPLTSGIVRPFPKSGSSPIVGRVIEVRKTEEGYECELEVEDDPGRTA